MKVLINAFSARLGGGQTYLKNLLAYIPEGMDVEILLYASESLRLPEDTRIRRCSTRWPTENPLLRVLWEKFILPGILEREQVHVLFCPGGVVSTKTKRKTVTMFRNMLPFDADALQRMPFGLQKIRNYILKPTILRSLRSADLTIFISEHARRVIEALTCVGNPVTIPHGINSEFNTYDQVVAKPSWLNQSEYILYVSRFDCYKHQLEVVLAYASLDSGLRKRYKLLLVGEADNSLADQVRSVVKEKGLEERVLITGPIPYLELPSLYHHASVNLFASSCENCPNILLEALGAGRPVLSSDIMPMPEFGGDSVEYFIPTDPVDIHRALNEVLTDGSKLSQLAKLAGKRSAAFNWERTAHKTWGVIDGLVSGAV